ncbi:hypothetical protein Fcan01_22363 [Folsomia candida]|uniref:Uncharacterized protein n=1 Tax=Folsomia candida TaxID=158441 RepID=A0A226DFD7_FOLCA|nr:hypothetical protein Fcan01_22363 [Folsomia candida]
MNVKKCNFCCGDGAAIRSKFRTVVLWLMVLFLTKSIYFLLSFYFLLWTVVYFGCTISTVIPRRAEHLHPHPHPHPSSSDKPGKALLIVLLILLAIITMLLCTIDRVYSPWIVNFLNGKIFSYCVQVSALVTLTVAICYIFAIATRTLCSSKKAGGVTTIISGGQQTSHHVTIRSDDMNNKSSFANPCYNVEFSISEGIELLGGGGGGGEGLRPGCKCELTEVEIYSGGGFFSGGMGLV